MRNFLSICFLLAATLPAHAQFSTDKLQVTLGYNLHNAYAKRFNHLIDTYNDARYPVEIEQNVNNINWLRGFVVGANYHFTEDIRFHAVVKNRRQFMETRYTNHPEYRQYFFRQHTLELGADLLLSEEKRFSHYAGAGVVLGVMGVFTNWTLEQGYNGTRDMINVDHTGVLGLSLSYEAQFQLHDNFRLYLRPVAQYSLNSHVRKLTDFFAPVVDEDGVYYLEGEADKYDSGNLNGLGIEGGLLILLPEF